MRTTKYLCQILISDSHTYTATILLRIWTPSWTIDRPTGNIIQAVNYLEIIFIDIYHVYFQSS